MKKNKNVNLELIEGGETEKRGVSPDFDTPMTLTVTPKQILEACFDECTTCTTSWEPWGEVLEEIMAVNTDSGSCRLLYDEWWFEDKPLPECHYIVELRLGDSYSLAFFDHGHCGCSHDHLHSLHLAREAMKRACCLLGVRVKEVLGVT